MEKFKPFTPTEKAEPPMDTEFVKENLIESVEVGPEINKKELKEAMGWIYENILANKLIGGEETVADEILQIMKNTFREQEDGEDIDSLWLVKSETGQLVLSFLRELANRSKKQPVIALKKFTTLSDAEQRKLVDWLFGTGTGKGSLLDAAYEVSKGLKENKEFILPVKKLDKVPSNGALIGDLFDAVVDMDMYWPGDMMNGLETEAVFEKILPESSRAMATEIAAANQKRFPICKVMRARNEIELERLQSGQVNDGQISTKEVLKEIFSNRKYTCADFSALMTYAKYGWESQEEIGLTTVALGSILLTQGGYRMPAIESEYSDGERRFDFEDLDQEVWDDKLYVLLIAK